MPRPLDALHSSTSQFYQNADQCSVPPDSGGVPSPTAASPATASTSETCPIDPGAEAHSGLLEKYTTDLSLFRRSQQAAGELTSTATPPKADKAPTVVPHDPEACNASVRTAVLDCLDAVANVLYGVEAASSTGSVGHVGIGIQIGTSTMRCSDAIEEAYDACTDRVVP
jgi:hypothetical protein